jgi:hypothetical protein
MAEHWLSRRGPKAMDGSAALDGGAKAARAAAKDRLSRRGPLYLALRAVTWLMKIDILLFGRVRSGPFFALLVKEPGPSSARGPS